MLIKNKNEIATTEMRREVLDIIEAGIEAVLPGRLVPSAVKYSPKMNSVTVFKRTYHLIRGRIFVVGGGKAAGLMAEELEKIIGPKNITAGAVNTVKGRYRTKKIEIIEAGHPLPDKRGIAGVKKMLELKNKYNIDRRDMIICLISGGGSALMPYPPEGIELEDRQRITELLIKSGAPIYDVNIVRKRMSRIKGGRLGRHYAPARVVSLIISDVVGDDLKTIASGPTVMDPSTFNDARHVLDQYELWDKAPKSIRDYINRGCADQEEETPKHLTNCDNYIIGNNAMALEFMALKARRFGFNPLILTFTLTGDPVVVADKIAREVNSGKYLDYDMLILGGETTPRIPQNSGQGGRNQHLAAASLLAMKNYLGDWAVASMATDGIDYLEESAGAIVDNLTWRTVKEKKIDVHGHIDNFDTYNLFKEIGGSHIVAGSTGTNVGDVVVWATR